MNLQLQDKLSRDKIINDLDRNFFVEAGAGSGKTYCLVERMVNLVKNGNAKIENIAAVTFTRKASAELKERFQIRLEQSLMQQPDTAQKACIKEALSNIEQAFIGTIHSFCSRILRERPVEAGVDPGFKEIEEEKDSVYADNTWPEYIEECYLNTSNCLLDFLEAHGILPNDLKDAYKRVIQFPDVEIITRELSKPDFNDVKKQVSFFVSYCQGLLPREAPEGGWDDLQKLIRRSSYFIKNGYLNNDILFVKMLKDLGKSAKVTQNRWQEGNGKSCEEQMDKFREEKVGPAIRSWQEYLHKPCADFVKKGAVFYEKWRNNHSILNFTDLLTITATLLKTNKEVRSYFKRKFTHVLVDEFQDTDPIQAELFLFLTGTDVCETDWRKIIPAPGSLFMVGDPKQSIYRFRRADIGIYESVKNIFYGSAASDSRKTEKSQNFVKNCDNSSEVLNLFSNFRSLPFMHELVEQVFRNVFTQEEEASFYQAKYFPLNTVRTEDKDFDCGVFENNIEKVPQNNAAHAAAVDAEKIACWIDFAVNKNGLKIERSPDETKSGLAKEVSYSDFLILSSKREHLGLYAQALEARSIPYDISGGKVFNKSTELNEVLKLFRAVEDDRDPVALVTALRGLFFGISDARLYDFSIAGGKFSFYSDIPDGFDDFKEAYERLARYKKLVKENEPIVAAEMIIENTGIIPLAISGEEGLTRAGNIYKALELLREYGEENGNLFFDLIKNLEELLKKSEVESLSLLASRQDVVRIMNLHKAKGLEAPIVILADPLGETSEFLPEYHISRTDSGSGLKSENISRGFFCIVKSNGNYGNDILAIPPEWDDKSAEETKYGSAEKQRLKYVAVTRAKNILVVSTYREGRKGKAWEILYDYLEKINARQIPVIKSSNENTPQEININPIQWDKEKEEISSIRKCLIAPGYMVENVTNEAKSSFSLSSEDNGEKIYIKKSGTSNAEWGILVHKALEIAGRGNLQKVKTMAQYWASDAGFGNKASNELIKIAEKFSCSDLFERIKNAGEKYFEVAFAISEENVIIHGVIDLVFLEAGKWIIVDYKTGDFGANKEQKSIYLKQLELYKKYWEKISGQEVSDTFLYKV